MAGIQREDGLYTALGHETVFYSAPSEFEDEIPVGVFLTILRKNALLNGKRGKYEFVKVREGSFVWVMNSEVMNALWNTMLLLELNAE